MHHASLGADEITSSTPALVGITVEDKGERAKRASLLEDENTRDEVREMATDGGYILYPLLS